MTESRALGRRGNPKGKAIYYGTATLTITGTATTTTSTTTFSPTYDSDPTLVIGMPKWSQTSGGSASYVKGEHYTTNDANLSFAIHVWLDAAPAAYKTVTLVYPYIVIGEPND